MSDATRSQVAETLQRVGLSDADLENLAGHLVWRVGRVTEDGPVTVRVGLASSVPLFNDLPRLRNASESEISAAMEEGDVRVEWVGNLPA